MQDGALGQGDIGVAAQRLQALFDISTEEAEGGGNASRQLGPVYPPARRPSMAAMLDSLADSEDTIQQRPRVDANTRAIKHRWDSLYTTNGSIHFRCSRSLYDSRFAKGVGTMACMEAAACHCLHAGSWSTNPLPEPSASIIIGATR